MQEPAALTTLSYDKVNRLVLSSDVTGTSTYTYAGDGMKRSELVAGALTTLVWDGSDHLQARS